ncbi:MAG: hypothetical protein L0K73_00600 [Corynebacterium variabile]|uniref:hypothetical protein n=1 Tax=Corynebacterium variabile TaxID=1727 RepID=UPI0026475AA6|nr:hypothetical protein [Corynebacterium variabile]MDN6535305.1 hypothetical protein [Corynebacterium variabile]
MPFAVVALVLGLVLLLVAAGLFLRASRPAAPGEHREPGRHEAGAPSPDRVRPAAWPSAAPSPAVEPEEAFDQEEPSGTDTTPEPMPEPTPAPAPEPSGFTGRRGRRHWAAAHGFEYTREDAFLTAEWPVSLIREISATDQGPAARDLVSGFLDGHQVHIADVAGSTLLALRRGAYSPVNVHITTTAAMPAGMRHDADLDRAPFTVYATDNRAVGRMLDSRVEGALTALSGTVSDVAFSGAWVVARCARRTDADRWDALLPHLVALGSAARVLPPLVTTATLDIAVADPTRPRPASGVHVSVEPAVEEAGEDRDTARPGHLRAVPDVPAAPEPEVEPDIGTGDAAETEEPGEPGEPTHPKVERPSDPVEFPTRSRGQVYGEADLDGSWPEDVTEDGLTSIPALGEEPTANASDDDGPRIVRAGTSATIFSDSTDSTGSTGTVSRGRHRGPDARHAGADRDSADSADDYDVVDPEVVDPDVTDPDN